MRKSLIALAASTFAFAACATAETAGVQKEERLVEVRVQKHVTTDGDGKHIKIHIERDGEEPIHIEGDPNSPEVKEALAKIGGSMAAVGGDDHHVKVMKSGDGEDHVWIMKVEGEEDGNVVIDLTSDDKGKHEAIVIKKDGKVTKLPMDGKDGKHVFITKDGDSKAHKEHSEKRVIVITGENEEEIKEKLEALDIEFDIDIEFDEEGEVKVEIKE